MQHGIFRGHACRRGHPLFHAAMVLPRRYQYGIGPGADLWPPAGYCGCGPGNAMRPGVFVDLQYLLFLYPQCDAMQNTGKGYTVGLLALKEILSVGMPSFLNSLGNSFVAMAGNQVLGAVGGTQAIGTFAVISRIQSFAATPFTGVMQGIQPMLGFDWGRKNTNRVRKTVFFALRFVLVYGILVSLGLYAGAQYIIHFFSANSDTARAGTAALQVICRAIAIGGVVPVIQAFFQALGQGKRVLSLSVASIFVIRLPLLLLGLVTKKLSVMWWVFVISDWAAAALAGFSYKKFQKENGYGKLDKEQAE